MTGGCIIQTFPFREEHDIKGNQSCKLMTQVRFSKREDCITIMNKRIFPLTFLILASIQCWRPSLMAESRAFTSVAGTVILGELVKIDGEIVTIKKEDGELLSVKAATFSPVDLVYLRQHGLAEEPNGVQPSGATRERPFMNSLGMRFVPVTGTKVLFCIHLVRIKDYASYAEDAPNVDRAWRSTGLIGLNVDRGSDCPVFNVNWNDARAFCAWLGKKEGRSYRLPTDREWSIAVGLGFKEKIANDTSPASLHYKLQKVFPWGTQWPPPNGAGNYADTSLLEKSPKSQFIAGYTDGYPTTSPVLSFKPNHYGLYDMSGNVLQWCEDLYSPKEVDRVLRGSSWGTYGRAGLALSWRNFGKPDSRSVYNGFRCVIEIPSK